MWELLGWGSCEGRDGHWMLVLGLAELCEVSLVAIALRVVAMSANEDLEEEMSLWWWQGGC